MWILKDKKIYPVDIENKLKELGLKNGDVVMGHFDLKPFGKLGNIRDKDVFYNVVIDTILSVIGNEGALIVPAFTHSLCKDQVFNIRTSKPIVGYLSEVAFKRYQEKQPYVYRSDDPIFSCIGFGEKAEELFKDLSVDCFGDDSVFGRLHNMNAKFLCFGFPFAVTYMHYVERRYNDLVRKIVYRYNKTFKGKVIDENNESRNVEYNYFVRDLKLVEYDFSILARELYKRRLLKKVELGGGVISRAYAWDVYNTIFHMMSKDIYCFLNKEKLKC